MNIETTIQDDHQAKITVEVDPERLDAAKQRAAVKIARKVRVPGFRPGKAPYHIIARQVGEAAILEEAIEIVVNDIYADVIKEAGIEPYTMGTLSNIPQQDPLTLEFLVPLAGTAELGDYQSIRVPYEPPSVTEEEIQEVIEDLRARQAVIEPVERPAQDGDEVTVKMRAERVNAAEDQNPTLIREQSNPVVINAGDEDDWPFPGFSKQLIGMSAGETKEIEYTWPEDAPGEALRGTQAIFYVEVEAVKSRTLPEVDDDFLAELGGKFDSIESLRTEIHSFLLNQKLNTYHEGYDEQVLDKGVEGATFKYSPQMLHDETHAVLEELEQRLKKQGLDMEMYKKITGSDDDALHEQSRPTAEKRLQNALFMEELGQVEALVVDEKELRQESINMMNYLLNNTDPKELKKIDQENLFRQVVRDVYSQLRSRQTLERLRQIASDGAFTPSVPSPVDELDDLDETDELEVESDAPEISISLSDEDTPSVEDDAPAA